MFSQHTYNDQYEKKKKMFLKNNRKTTIIALFQNTLCFNSLQVNFFPPYLLNLAEWLFETLKAHITVT